MITLREFIRQIQEDTPANSTAGGLGGDPRSPHGYIHNNTADAKAASASFSSTMDQYHNDLHSISTRTIGDTDDNNKLSTKYAKTNARSYTNRVPHETHKNIKTKRSND